MYVRGYLQSSENGRVVTIIYGRGMMKVRNQPKLEEVATSGTCTWNLSWCIN